MDWVEKEITNFLGIASANRKPALNQFNIINNWDLRENYGDLVTRKGEDTKYSAPTDTRLTSKSYLFFDNFYVPDVSGGKEITVEILSATLNGESSGQTLGVPSSIDIICFFAREHWGIAASGNITSADVDSVTTDITTSSTTQYVGGYLKSGGIKRKILSHTSGTNAVFTVEAFDTAPGGTVSIIHWVNSWQWLNECYMTKIRNINADDWKLELDFTDANLVNGELKGWTVVNISKEPTEAFRVVKSYDVGSNQVGLQVDCAIHGWADSDTVLIMRNYLPYDYMTAMAEVTREQITTHKVLNDLRIGFGGYENRLGISIGYRDKYYNIGSFNSSYGYTAGEVEDYAEINGIIIDPYYPYIEGDTVRVDLTAVSSGNFAADTYGVLINGIVDGFEEYFITKSTIELAANEKIQVSIKFRPGKLNKRLTGFRIYCGSETDEVYFYVKDINFSVDEYTNNLVSVISTEGYAELSVPVDYVPSGSAVGSGDSNSQGTWLIQNGTINVTAHATPPPNYYFNVIGSSSAYAKKARLYLPVNNFEAGRKYNCSFTIRGTTGLEVRAFLSDASTFFNKKSDEEVIISLPAAFAAYTQEFTAQSGAARLVFEIALLSTQNFDIDEVTLELVDDLTNIDSGDLTEEEMNEKMGYISTGVYALSWDQAKVVAGRTYVVNPYFDSRYINKIFYSAIAGSGAFMYDVITPQNYLDMENFDGNSIVGIEILRNMNFLVLRNNSAEVRDRETGITLNMSFGKGTIARRSIVNDGETVKWCGENDVYASDGLNFYDLSDKTIRDVYRIIDTKEDIIATREEKDNAYRFFTGDTGNKTEYLLTKLGWIKRSNTDYPAAYTIAKDGTVWFMPSVGANAGKIIYEGTGTVTHQLRTVDFDIDLLGDNVKQNMRLLFRAFTIRYVSKVDPLTLDFKVYLDGMLYKTFSGVNVGGSASNIATLRKAMMPKMCKRFSLDISGTDPYGASISISSIGILFKLVSVGRWA